MLPAVAPKFEPVMVTLANVFAGKVTGEMADTTGSSIPVYVPNDGCEDTPVIVTVNRTRTFTATSVNIVQAIDTAVNHTGFAQVEPDPVAPYDTTGATVLLPKF